MKPPRYLVGSALLFWGFETNWLGAAALMALLMEGAHHGQRRWRFSDGDLNHVWDFCAVLFVGALAIRYVVGEQSVAAAYQFFQWFPFIFLPMALAQNYGNRAAIPLSAFSWFLRRRQSQGQGIGQTSSALHVGYCYFGACLLSAGAANRRDLWFFSGVCLLLGWAFWDRRPRTCRTFLWIGSLALAIALAFGGQFALTRLQSVMEGRVSDWFAGQRQGEFQANATRTLLGNIGIRKQSGRIVMRVRNERGEMEPLLRQASYDTFTHTVWLASRTQFAEVEPDSDATSWTLHARRSSRSCLTVFAALPRSWTGLALPSSANRLEQLPVAAVRTNALGVVQVLESPAWIAYRAWHGAGSSREAPPDPIADLQVPQKELLALRELRDRLSLSSLSNDEKVAAIESYFRSNYEYALAVPENAYPFFDSETPLSRFLTKTKRGHCEYFATAAVLLLRAAGIPARYATGYSVHETSGDRSMYVVRERHAHAWALAWLDGRWNDLDTTPGSWIESEATRASSWERLGDCWSELRFRFQKWRWSSERGWMGRNAVWLLAPFLMISLWRLFRRRERITTSQGQEKTPRVALPGDDSEFYAIERCLSETAGKRTASEPLLHWVKRVAENETKAGQARLRQLLGLHYRHRFDPLGLSETERADLRAGVGDWLRQWKQNERAKKS